MQTNIYLKAHTKTEGFTVKVLIRTAVGYFPGKRKGV
jgi:hypothetical protein